MPLKTVFKTIFSNEKSPEKHLRVTDVLPPRIILRFSYFCALFRQQNKERAKNNVSHRKRYVIALCLGGFFARKLRTEPLKNLHAHPSWNAGLNDAIRMSVRFPVRELFSPEHELVFRDFHQKHSIKAILLISFFARIAFIELFEILYAHSTRNDGLNAAIRMSVRFSVRDRQRPEDGLYIAILIQNLFYSDALKQRLSRIMRIELLETLFAHSPRKARLNVAIRVSLRASVWFWSDS